MDKATGGEGFNRMASKVNVKFVVLLSGFLVLAAAGVGGAYFFVKYRSGDRYVSRGDSAMKEGKIDLADSWYERAVGKDPTNVEWLRKWRKAREQKIPTTQTAYSQNYEMYKSILRSLSLVLKTDVEAHREYLQAIYQECSFMPVKGAWEYLIRETEDHLRYFDEPPNAIRRYRGIGMAELSIADTAATQETRDKAGQDLQAVLKADPKDGAVALELAVWYRYMADRAKAAGDNDAQKKNFDASRKVLVDTLAADPGNVPAQIGLLTFDASDVDQLSTVGMSRAEIVKLRGSALDTLAPRVKGVADAIIAAGPAKVNPLLVNRFVVIAPRIDTKSGSDIANAVLDQGLAADPENMDLLLFKAQLASQALKTDEMIGYYQKIIDSKDLPVSLNGLRLLGLRNRARFAQANAALQLIPIAKDADARQAAIERAKNFRKVLATFVPEQSPELQFIDAAMASIEGNISKARQLLAELLKKPGDISESTAIEAMLLMADVGQRSNPPELGLARENFQRVLAARPRSIEVRFRLAEVERQLQNYVAAAAHYKAILEIDPENAAAQAEYKILTQFMEGQKADDPVTEAILQAERASRGTATRFGDEEGAAKVLQDAMEPNNYDPRLVIALLGLKVAKNDRDAAKAICDQALSHLSEEGATEARKAGIAQIKEFQKRLKAAETSEGAVAFIKEVEMPALDKQLALARTYSEFGKKDEAAAALNEAIKLGPDDSRVIEIQFQRALATPDFAEAGRLAERAAKLDLDLAEGETFKARIQIAQKNYKDAAGTLSRVVDRGNAVAAVYRLLGLVQAELGRMEDAKSTFRRALDLTPNDLVTIKSYLSVLIKAGESQEALGVARKAEIVGRNDAEFLNIWLNLEGQAGNTRVARDRREQLRERNPKDIENAASLADLYMDERSWAAARKLIDAMRTEHDSLRAVSLDARWYADQGDMNQAKNMWRQYLGQLIAKDEKQMADPYLAFGQFLVRHGQEQEGLAAIKQATRFQDPATHSVDIMLGDFQLNGGHFDDAEKTYRIVLDAKVPDPVLRVRKRLIEALNQQKKFAEAEAEFVALGTRAEEDVELMAQRAAAARGLGDLAKAREILDRAVSKYPDEPMPYLRRARMVMLDPAMAKDAMADLATAIKLRPGFWQALRTRAMLEIRGGRVDDGLQDMKDASDRNPGNDELRLEVVDYLARFGKESDAVDAANNIVKSRPSEVRLLSQIANVFVRNVRWARAAKFQKLIWDQVQDEATAVDYVNSLLNSTPPNAADAEEVFAGTKLKVDKSSRLLLYRGLVKKKQNKDAGWKADTLASFDLACANFDSLYAWTREVRAIYPDAGQCAQVYAMSKAPGELQGWVDLAMAGLALDDPKAVDQTIQDLRNWRGKIQDRNLKIAIQRRLSDALIRQEKWEEAVKELELGLQTSPGESLFSNNAAVLLSENLKRPKEAMPFAERACAAEPGNWAYVDTLASVLWEMGDKAQALRRLEDARRVSGTEIEKAKTIIKMALWKFRSGDKIGAQVLVREAQEMMIDNPTLADAVKTEFQDLVKEIDSTPGK